ncbi:MAG: hypothetical protein VB144_11985 [Clostridia bacterium]|nr:hypothetical protein [Clostridia bacterium]
MITRKPVTVIVTAGVDKGMELMIRMRLARVVREGGQIRPRFPDEMGDFSPGWTTPTLD